MMPFLPNLPFVPAFLRRKPDSWPGNPRLVALDLRESLDNEAKLAEQLVQARKEADRQAARAAAFEQRAQEADRLIAEVQELRQLRAGRSK